MKNKCPFLPIGNTKVCNKNCYALYCHGHNLTMKKHEEPPKPCLKCGVGTFSCIQLCCYCSKPYSTPAFMKRIQKYMNKTNKPFEEVRDFLISCL